MSNYVINKVNIKKLNTSGQYEKAIRELTMNVYDNDILISQRFDFNKLIPEPNTKEECPKKYILPEGKDKPVITKSEKPWFDWWNWRLQYWGTKWNASEIKTIYHHDSIILIFQTPWSFPAGIVNKLAKMGYDFEWSYAEEDRGSTNSGIIACEQLGEGEYKIDEEHGFDEDWIEDLWDTCYDAEDGAMYK